MNKYLGNMISAVADNDLDKAKDIARIVIANSTAKCDESFCRHIKRKLDSRSRKMMELPANIQGLLRMEDIGASFNENRYYLSDREATVFNDIVAMYETSQKLSEMGIRYLNAVLLYGESGTGKTMFGRYVAYKLKLPFVYLNFSNIISSYLGKTAKHISQVFEFIRSKKCVLMIDELDMIGMFRGKEDVGEMSRIVIGLMQEMDLIDNDAILISATNRVDMIDKALMRRFTLKHEVRRFNNKELEAMVRMLLNDINARYTLTNIRQYLSVNNKCQALIMNDVIKAIAQSVKNDSDVILHH